MKFLKLLFLLTSTALVVSCSNLKTPIYQDVEDIKISKIVNDSITLKASLYFKNPNRIKGKMLLKNVHTIVNDIDLGFLKNQEIKVPSNDNFTIPLEIKLSYHQLFNAKKGLLNSLLNSILTNEVTVKFEGEATFKKFLIQKKYPIKFSEKIKILK